MGLKRSPNKVKLIVGLIANEEGLLEKTKRGLEKIFRNTVDFESALLDFHHTDYYRKEFGNNLKRVFLSFERLADLKDIYKIKIKTNALEKRFSSRGRRTINIDPGYLDLSKLVLFSAKDYSHRIYFGGGIFAEVTLYFKDKTFNPWPWTYPDYKSKGYIDIFNHIREEYKKAIA